MNLLAIGRSASVKAATGVLALSLAGCATLPSSGPTGHEVLKPVSDPLTNEPLQIVEVSDVAVVPVFSDLVANTLVDTEAPPTDMVGPGDVLDISIFEVGVSLFGASVPSAGAIGIDPAANAKRLPPIRVSDSGTIQIPYVGQLAVAGRRLPEISAQIRQSLTRMSQDPQVTVSLQEAITNSVIVGGEVGRPGRLVLPTNRETLSDVIALAGGYRGDAKDLTLRVSRKGTESELRLSAVLNGSERDARIYPGDRITALRTPRSFSVMGASGRVEQIPFSTTRVSLAEAIATAGGANPSLGDARAVFVFRIAPDENGRERSVIYHINMMKVGGYFLAQRFAIRDKDVLYIGNARSNQPSKFVQIISQLFTPILTVTSAAQVLRR